MDPYTLLIIARTQYLAKHLQGTLDGDQFLIRWAQSTAHALMLDLDPSLMLLDLPLSGGSRSVARLKRRFHAPVLALTRTSQAIPEQVDASLSSPFHMERLVALIKTTLIDHAPNRIRAAGMSLDTETRRLQINGAIHQLRPLACQIMAVLMGQAGTVVPREELFRRVWRTEDGDDTRALDVHIAHLRRQLEANPRQPQLILTERGLGYRLQPPE